jgi:Kef-type K+ transport system membrane component KefB
MLNFLLETGIDSYYTIIGICIVVILSFVFNIISKKTNIPSVLLLILLGLGIQYLLKWLDFPEADLFATLQVLGIIGLIMIVLEAALDLKLTREKAPLILKSLAVALIALIGSSFVCAYIINYYLISDPFISLVYAIPLSIMSSAIIIPSVSGLVEHKKEFMIYESTFSDILGIMFFYFLIGTPEGSTAGQIAFDVTLNIIITMVASFVISFALILIFQRLTTQVKLFLLIAILTLLYAIGKKLFQLSSLIIIMAFGLIINNYKIFFIGPFKKWIKDSAVDNILRELHFITLETAFVIRTFFFVVFGMTISLTSLISFKVAFVSLCIILALYIVRYICLKIFLWRDIIPQLYIAPRGLITILLFFAIPIQMQDDNFKPGILLYTILISSLIMTYSLVVNKDKKEKANLSEPQQDIESDTMKVETESENQTPPSEH